MALKKGVREEVNKWKGLMIEQLKEDQQQMGILSDDAFDYIILKVAGI